ncbi:porin [Pelagicoccus sp. SDUM812003]|uniref:porin n=1 Tax=Pelagicoccus sp. SDUM812003 TaxID=3041267 RepID=UPI00280E73EB|nr:porin [Pelagicoccus sp. SDUM812003]MDQ8205234.1 porin [Pelagicoccus sp. SDUM812003]
MKSSNPHWKRRALAGIATLSALAGNHWASAQELPSREEMWAIIQQQQAEIEALKERVGMTEGTLQETQQAISIASEQVEATASFVEEVVADTGSGAASPRSKTSIGGYGELHYNFGKKDQADFHRWVLFFGHEFNDRVRMFSEVELEHSIAGDGQPGEVELEQAFIEFDLNETDKLKAGLFLLPVGILNETHEPATFYGVERNNVEKNIIPTTWWEGGLAYTHQNASGWAFDAAAHSGLYVPTSGSKAFNIRSGRQKVGEAEASDGAITTRATYSGLPGMQFGVTAQYQGDLAQGTLAETADATLLSAHADIQRGGFGLRALYARWDIGGALAGVNGADEQFGYYIEPSYRFATETGDWGLFARYSVYDTFAGDDTDSEDSFFDLGVNYWPIDNVVFKADVQFTDYADSSKNEEIVNLGVGYHF